MQVSSIPNFLICCKKKRGFLRVGVYLGGSAGSKIFFRTYDTQGKLIEVRLFLESDQGAHDLTFFGQDITKLEMELITFNDVAVNVVVDTLRFKK